MEQNSACRRNVQVNLENGLHLVPCSRIAQLARRFECGLFINKGQVRVDAKDVFALMTLNAGRGTELVLEGHGNGCDAAVESLAQLFASNFEVADSAED
jgi:phosphotransferase system HPr (HPr) family protein